MSITRWSQNRFSSPRSPRGEERKPGFANFLQNVRLNDVEPWVRRALRGGREGRCEFLFTVDRNLPFQQDLRASGIAIVIAVARTNRVKEPRPLMPKVLDAPRIVKAGEVVSIGD